MLRFTASLLPFLPIVVSGFPTHEDALPTYSHQGIAEYGAQENDAVYDSEVTESDVSCNSKAVSFIQRKAQAHEVTKARSTEHFGHATRDEVKEQWREQEGTEAATEERFAKLERQIAVLQEEQKQAHLEAQLQERAKDLRGHADLHHAGRLRKYTSLSLEQHGDLNEAQRQTALEESDSDEIDTLEVEMGGHYILHRRLMVFVAVVLLGTFMGIAACNYLDPSDDEAEDKVTPGDEVELRGNLSLPEDTLGFMICVWARDGEAIYNGTSNRTMRIARILLAMSVLSLNMFLQVFLCICICVYVVPGYVKQIRDAYDLFEVAMYDNHTVPSPINGFSPRGEDGYFNFQRFNLIPRETQETLCQSPWSQLFFFVPLLFIWTLRCLREIRNACDLFLVLIARMPTVPTLADQLFHRKEPTGEVFLVIVGLTVFTKIAIACGMLIPRILVSSYICWLGSRWLSASPDLGELVLNTVALELMVELKDLLYAALISTRNQRDLARTEVRPPSRKEKASIWLYLSSAGWCFAALFWVLFYMFYFQMVLIDFKWDLQRECHRWFKLKADII